MILDRSISKKNQTLFQINTTFVPDLAPRDTASQWASPKNHAVIIYQEAVVPFKPHILNVIKTGEVLINSALMSMETKLLSTLNNKRIWEQGLY